LNDSLLFRLSPEVPDRLQALQGECGNHLRLLEKRLNINIYNRDYTFQLLGDPEQVQVGKMLLEALYAQAATRPIDENHIHLLLQESQQQGLPTARDFPDALGERSEKDERNGKSKKPIAIQTRRQTLQVRSPRQQQYIEKIRQYDLSFGVGPAGTGKTYLAAACAVEALEKGEVEHLILVRPAVEAGEKLGFLPGDLQQKIDPYLRPLYDALRELLGADRFLKLFEKQIIELAPLAYMRGRTLNHAFIILDEAQNTTSEQMKMFLTRLGFGSKAVVTGDITQIDLAKGQRSGLIQALDILKDQAHIGFTFFERQDVVRHPLVQQIIEAYEKRGN
jgi:phosphate starvation-inducible PhoH-like protein